METDLWRPITGVVERRKKYWYSDNAEKKGDIKGRLCCCSASLESRDTVLFKLLLPCVTLTVPHEKLLPLTLAAESRSADRGSLMGGVSI